MAEVYQYRNFYSIIVNNARQNPNKTIIYDGDLKISNQQLLAHADNIASYLADSGIKAGDKVALVMSSVFMVLFSFRAWMNPGKKKEDRSPKDCTAEY